MIKYCFIYYGAVVYVSASGKHEAIEKMAEIIESTSQGGVICLPPVSSWTLKPYGPENLNG